MRASCADNLSLTAFRRYAFKPKTLSNRRGKPDLVLATVRHGPKKGEKGFVDTDGRIWIRDLAHAEYPEHWDVQVDDGKDYFRVGDDGNAVKKVK